MTSERVELTVVFEASACLDLTAICEELSIDIRDVDQLHMKYCHLFFTLKDGRSLQYATEAYEASFDAKYPDWTKVSKGGKLVATSRGGWIKLAADPDSEARES